MMSQMSRRWDVPSQPKVLVRPNSKITGLSNIGAQHKPNINTKTKMAITMTIASNIDCLLCARHYLVPINLRIGRNNNKLPSGSSHNDIVA